jgi:hypothetical protein
MEEIKCSKHDIKLIAFNILVSKVEQVLGHGPWQMFLTDIVSDPISGIPISGRT